MSDVRELGFDEWWSEWNACRCGLQEHARLSASNAWYRQAHRIETERAKNQKLTKALEKIADVTSGLSLNRFESYRDFELRDIAREALREALQYYANRMGSGGTAREALRGDK